MTSTETYPKTVIKPWGKEIWLELNDRYCYKKIILNAGTRSSLQHHNLKLETQQIIEGHAEVWLENDNGTLDKKKIGPGSLYTILPGRKHRVIAITDVVLYEISTPEVNDIVRHQDDYDRVSEEKEAPDISEQHKTSKNKGYWKDLDSGNTTTYKKKVIEKLITNLFSAHCKSIIDIGCGGNCDHILTYKKKLNASHIACFDYDENIIAQMKRKYPNQGIQWHINDIFALQQWEKQYDLVFFLDILHEIYSFYGRPDRDVNQPINHNLGLQYVRRAVLNVIDNMNPRGIVITDSNLCESNDLIRVKLKSEQVIKAIKIFLNDYPTFKIKANLKGNVLEIREQDFCNLSTQYNKIKREDWDRWNVERLEKHQYMALSEFEMMFGSRGYCVHAVVETPPLNLAEWEEDFEILSVAKKFPEKRITLLAVKE